MKKRNFLIALIALVFTVSFTPSVYSYDVFDGAQTEAVITVENDLFICESPEGVLITFMEVGVEISPGDKLVHADKIEDPKTNYIYKQKYLPDPYCDFRSALTNSFVNYTVISSQNDENYMNNSLYSALNSVNISNERQVLIIYYNSIV